MGVKWNSILIWTRFLYLPLILYGVYDISRLPKEKVGDEEASYHTSSAPPSIKIDPGSIGVLESRISGVGFRHIAGPLADFFSAGGVTRSLIEINEICGNKFVAIDVIPPLFDGKDAFVVPCILGMDHYESFSSAAHFAHLVKHTATVPYLAKAVTFLFVLRNDERGSSVREFLDWYLYDETSEANAECLKSYKRHGIIRSSVSLQLFPSRRGAFGGTGLEPRVMLWATKTGIRGPNIDYFAKSLSVARSWGMTSDRQSQLMVEALDFNTYLPHTYWNEQSIDAFAVIAEDGVEGASAVKAHVVEAGELLIRASNEMVVHFHHLSNQWWFELPHSQTTLTNLLLGMIFVYAATLVCALSSIVAVPEAHGRPISKTMDVGNTWRFSPAVSTIIQFYQSRYEQRALLTSKNSLNAAGGISEGVAPAEPSALIGGSRVSIAGDGGALVDPAGEGEFVRRSRPSGEAGHRSTSIDPATTTSPLSDGVAGPIAPPREGDHAAGCSPLVPWGSVAATAIHIGLLTPLVTMALYHIIDSTRPDVRCDSVSVSKRLVRFHLFSSIASAALLTLLTLGYLLVLARLTTESNGKHSPASIYLFAYADYFERNLRISNIMLLFAVFASNPSVSIILLVTTSVAVVMPAPIDVMWIAFLWFGHGLRGLLLEQALPLVHQVTVEGMTLERMLYPALSAAQCGTDSRTYVMLCTHAALLGVQIFLRNFISVFHAGIKINITHRRQ